MADEITPQGGEVPDYEMASCHQRSAEPTSRGSFADRRSRTTGSVHRRTNPVALYSDSTAPIIYPQRFTRAGTQFSQYIQT
jgi:hypothetical protein